LEKDCCVVLTVILRCVSKYIVMDVNTEKVRLAHDILKQAIESDEGTFVGEDDFEEKLSDPDYPEGQVFRWINCNLKIIREVLGRTQNGRTKRVVLRACNYMSNPDGSHGYSEEVAAKITGLSNKPVVEIKSRMEGG